MEEATKEPLVVLHEMDICTLKGIDRELIVTFLEFESDVELAFENLQKCVIETIDDLNDCHTNQLDELQSNIVTYLKRFGGEPTELFLFKKSFNDEAGFMSLFVYNTKYKAWNKRVITPRQRLLFKNNQLIAAISS